MLIGYLSCIFHLAILKAKVEHNNINLQSSSDKQSYILEKCKL